MSGFMGTTFANDVLALILNATGIANIADNTATSPLTNLYWSLHTASPTAAGNQTSNEAAYPTYGRVAASRSNTGFTGAAGVWNPAATVVFPTSTGTPSETETYAGLGSATSGSGKLFFAGTVSPTLVVTNPGVTPQLTTASTITMA